MQLRLPWLNSRRRLLAALLVDSVLFALLYTAFFLRRFGVWPEWNLPLGGLLGFWLVGSYVIGRYYDAAEMRSSAAIKQAIRTLITLMLSIGVFFAWLWLTASPSLAETSRGIMLPMLLVFALSSGLLQQGVNRLLEGRFSGKELWLVQGQAGFQCQLHQELGWSRLEARLQPVDLSHAAGPDPGQGGPKSPGGGISGEPWQQLCHLSFSSLRSVVGHDLLLFFSGFAPRHALYTRKDSRITHIVSFLISENRRMLCDWTYCF